MRKILVLLFLLLSVFMNAQQHTPYKIIAYYTGPGEMIKRWPVEKLSHIIFSFLRIQNDSLVFQNEKQEKSLLELIELKKEYPALKIMVSIGGWSGCAFCSDMFASAERRLIFAKTAAALFEKYSIDGLDLDWEYPAIEGYPGHKFMPEDKNNFTGLIKDLRNQFGNKYLLTFAAGGFIKYLEESVDWDAVIPNVDFVNLMTYDLVGGYATTTGHHTPLHDYRPGQESTSKCVNWLLKKKVPAEKLIIGAAMYARVWENIKAVNNGLYQTGKFKRGVGFNEFKSYFNDTSGYKYYWDKNAGAPYRYNKTLQLFATFDDERSIKEKTKFVRHKKLGGIMFWELLQDKKENGLVDKMYEGLKK